MPKETVQPVDVILIHGTLPPWQWWNRVDSDGEVRKLFSWTDTKAQGSLAGRIASIRKEGFKVCLSLLPWRGSNAGSAREEGASRLAEILAADPDRPKLLVAHSHGGNVAFRALQQAGVPRSVYGRNTEFRAYAGESLLLHSIYSSDEVQTDVVEWIEGRLPSVRPNGLTTSEE